MYIGKKLNEQYMCEIMGFLKINIRGIKKQYLIICQKNGLMF